MVYRFKLPLTCLKVLLQILVVSIAVKKN